MERASKKYGLFLNKETHGKSEPLIKLLKESEEPSGFKEEDENIEVLYSKTAIVPKVKTVKSDKNKDVDSGAV